MIIEHDNDNSYLLVTGPVGFNSGKMFLQRVYEHYCQTSNANHGQRLSFHVFVTDDDKLLFCNSTNCEINLYQPKCLAAVSVQQLRFIGHSEDVVFCSAIVKGRSGYFQISESFPTNNTNKLVESDDEGTVMPLD